MAGTYSQYTRSFNSFSGVDMVVTFSGIVVGELQGLSYTITREKAPLYTMGSPDPRSFSRGKRGIAGSMIFLNFDRNALIESLRFNPKTRYVGRGDDASLEQLRKLQPFSQAPQEIPEFGSRLGADTTANGGEQVVPLGFTEHYLLEPTYLDQIPPLNVVITAVNEYGHTMAMSIRGVEFLNTGSGMSIDDMTIDETCTFVATAVTRWQKQGYVDADGVYHDAHSSDKPPIGGSLM
jgi:hypothetical protein